MLFQSNNFIQINFMNYVMKINIFKMMFKSLLPLEFSKEIELILNNCAYTEKYTVAYAEKILFCSIHRKMFSNIHSEIYCSIIKKYSVVNTEKIYYRCFSSWIMFAVSLSQFLSPCLQKYFFIKYHNQCLKEIFRKFHIIISKPP